MGWPSEQKLCAHLYKRRRASRILNEFNGDRYLKQYYADDERENGDSDFEENWFVHKNSNDSDSDSVCSRIGMKKAERERQREKHNLYCNEEIETIDSIRKEVRDFVLCMNNYDFTNCSRNQEVGNK
jgi:hypothetical protein